MIAERGGRIGNAISGLTETLFNVYGSSTSPVGHSDWLARGGVKLMTFFVANFKPNAKFTWYGTGDGEEVSHR